MPTDVLFINLPQYESRASRKALHLGQLYVMTSLNKVGYNVAFLDCAKRNSRLPDMLDLIRKSETSIVAFSVDTDNIYSFCNISHIVKKEISRDIKVLAGGPSAVSQSEEIMKLSTADVLVIGEGEYSAREVLDCFLRHKGNLQDIDGICFRKPSGAWQYTPSRPTIENIDTLPFPNRNFIPNIDEYDLTIITGRGCPHKCSFCFEGRMGNRYRHRSAENIVSEMEEILSRTRNRIISITDNTFTSDPKHTVEVCELMSKRLRPLEDYALFCEVRADCVNRHPEIVDALLSAGVVRIQIGAESADEGILRNYNRSNVGPEVVESVVNMFHKAGMPSIYCGFILGGPGETLDSMKKTFDFAKHLLLEVAPGSFECGAAFLSPLPGTKLYVDSIEYDLKLLDRKLITSTNFNMCVTETEALGWQEINNFREFFQTEIVRLTRELYRTLPRSVIQKHSDLYNRFRLYTKYKELLRTFGNLEEYFDLVGDGRCSPSSQLSDEEILEKFPTRLSSPFEVKDGNISITGGPNVLNLNLLGTEIFKLSSGKLRTKEFLAPLKELLGEAAPKSGVLLDDTIGFVRELDSHYAIILKDY